MNKSETQSLGHHGDFYLNGEYLGAHPDRTSWGYRVDAFTEPDAQSGQRHIFFVQANAFFNTGDDQQRESLLMQTAQREAQRLIDSSKWKQGEIHKIECLPPTEKAK